MQQDPFDPFGVYSKPQPIQKSSSIPPPKPNYDIDISQLLQQGNNTPLQSSTSEPTYPSWSVQTNTNTSTSGSSQNGAGGKPMPTKSSLISSTSSGSVPTFEVQFPPMNPMPSISPSNSMTFSTNTLNPMPSISPRTSLTLPSVPSTNTMNPMPSLSPRNTTTAPLTHSTSGGNTPSSFVILPPPPSSSGSTSPRGHSPRGSLSSSIPNTGFQHSSSSSTASTPVMQPTPITTSSSTSSFTASTPAATYQQAVHSMNTALMKLEKGVFPEALEEINKTISILGSIPDVKTVKKEMVVAVNYKLVLLLLEEIRKSDKNAAKCALLTRIMAEIGIQPKHRLSCVKMAIQKNLEARNFKTAARLIKGILHLNLSDGKQLEAMLKNCQDNGLEDYAQYPYFCPSCTASVNCGDLQCSQCNTTVLFCAKTYMPITLSTFAQCTLCDSVFTGTTVIGGTKCPFCNVGSVSTCTVPTVSDHGKLPTKPPASKSETIGSTKPVATSSKVEPPSPRGAPEKISKEPPAPAHRELPVAPTVKITSGTLSTPATHDKPSPVPQLPPKDPKLKVLPSTVDSTKSTKTQPQVAKEEPPKEPPKPDFSVTFPDTSTSAPPLPAKPPTLPPKETKPEPAYAFPESNDSFSVDFNFNSTSTTERAPSPAPTPTPVSTPAPAPTAAPTPSPRALPVPKSTTAPTPTPKATATTVSSQPPTFSVFKPPSNLPTPPAFKLPTPPPTTSTSKSTSTSISNPSRKTPSPPPTSNPPPLPAKPGALDVPKSNSLRQTRSHDDLTEVGENPMPSIQRAQEIEFRTPSLQVTDPNKITDEEKARYTQNFRHADKNNDGFIDGNEAKEYFSSSSCPKQKLAVIWRLADVDKDGKLNLEEFVIAEHYLSVQLNGGVLPNVLPSELIAYATQKSNSASSTKQLPVPPSKIGRTVTPPPIPDHDKVGPGLSDKALPPLPLPRQHSDKEISSPPVPTINAPIEKPLPSVPPPKPSSTPETGRRNTISGPAPSFLAPPPTETRARSDSASKKKEDKKEKGDKKKEEKEKRKKKEKQDKKEKKKFGTFAARGKRGVDAHANMDESDAKSMTAPSVFSISAPPVKPQVEPKPEPTPPPVLTPPPTIFTPPMLSNSLAESHHFDPVLRPTSNPTVDSPPSPRSPPLPPREQPEVKAPTPPLPSPRASPRDEAPPPPVPPRDEELPPIPLAHKPSSLPTKPPVMSVPPPQVEKPVIEEITRQWQYFTSFTQGRAPAPKDYLADVPAPVALVVRFSNKLFIETRFADCHQMFSNELRAAVSLEQLTQLGGYYSSLGSFWYCMATSFEQSSIVVVFLPLYFDNGQSYQVKAWVSEDVIAGLEVSAYDEEKWKEEGRKAQWVVAAPKTVKRTDGSVKEIHSPKEELEALVDPKVPVGIQVGAERRFKVAITLTAELKQKKPSLVRRGKDGKKYHVFSDASSVLLTAKAHPNAVCREYWFTKDEYVVYLVDRCGERVTDETFIELVDGNLESLAAHKKDKHKHELAKKTLPSLEYFYVVLPTPMESVTQSMVLNSLRGSPAGFTSTDRKTYVQSIAPGEKKINLVVEWEISMRPCALKPLYEGEVFVKDTRKVLISSDERKEALQSTNDFDLKEKSFQDWLVKVGLFRGIYGFKEANLQFAHRAFTITAKQLKFIHPCPPDLKVSEILKNGQGDSVAINKFFVAILRANDIPARVVYGRLAQSKKKGAPVTWIGGESDGDNDQTHAQSQFFVEDVGWVSCDPSQCVRNVNNNFDDKNVESLSTHFACDKGNFIALSASRTLVDVPVHGPMVLQDPVGFNLLFDHKKLNYEWQVENR